MIGNITIKRKNSNYGRKYYKKLSSVFDKMKLFHKYTLHINRNINLPSVSKLATMISKLDKEAEHNHVFRLDEKIGDQDTCCGQFDKYKYSVSSNKWNNTTRGIWLVRNEDANCGSDISIGKFNHRFFCNEKKKCLKGYPFIYFIIAVLLTILVFVIIHSYRSRKRRVSK